MVAAVTMLSWSEFVLPALPIPLIIAANWHARPPGGQGLAELARIFGQMVWLLLATVAGGCLLLGLLTLLSAVNATVPEKAPTVQSGALAGVLVLTGLTAASMLSRRTRQGLGRLLPIDPDSALDATALVLTVVMVGTQLGSQLAVDVLAEQAGNGASLQPVDLLAQELPFLLAAFLGVGLLTRRSPRDVLERLGLVRPQVWQVFLALAAAGAFYGFAIGADTVTHVLTPDTAGKVDAANQQLFRDLDGPVGILTLALSAGICEEALFRGALQPRLGILWTSIVFTAVHAQYGLSLTAVAVLVLAIGLGSLRRLTNTTTSTICHVAYNTLVGVAVGGSWLVAALLVAAGLVVASLGAFLTGRLLGSPRTAQ